jgi:hypothetical protein
MNPATPARVRARRETCITPPNRSTSIGYGPLHLDTVSQVNRLLLIEEASGFKNATVKDVFYSLRL